MIGFAPVLVMIALAAVIGGRYAVSMPAGTLLFAGGVLALWYGRDLGRGVLPGVVGGHRAGARPVREPHGPLVHRGALHVVVLARLCDGGVLAGGIVSFFGFKHRRGPGYWVSASGITLLTGALGCSCVGFAGIGGLALGFMGALLVGKVSSLSRRPAGY